jgi:hypothetical protein
VRNYDKYRQTLSLLRHLGNHPHACTIQNSANDTFGRHAQGFLKHVERMSSGAPSRTTTFVHASPTNSDQLVLTTQMTWQEGKTDDRKTMVIASKATYEVDDNGRPLTRLDETDPLIHLWTNTDCISFGSDRLLPLDRNTEIGTEFRVGYKTIRSQTKKHVDAYNRNIHDIDLRKRAQLTSARKTQTQFKGPQSLQVGPLPPLSRFESPATNTQDAVRRLAAQILDHQKGSENIEGLTALRLAAGLFRVKQVEESVSARLIQIGHLEPTDTTRPIGPVL